MKRRTFMKLIGGFTAVVASPSIAVSRLEKKPDNFAIFPKKDIEGNSWKKHYGGKTYISRALPGSGSPLGCGIYHHAGWGDGGCSETILCNESLFLDDWHEFLRRYKVMRNVIEGTEVVKDEKLQKMDRGDLLYTLHRVSAYLRYYGMSERTIHSAVRPW